VVACNQKLVISEVCGCTRACVWMRRVQNKEQLRKKTVEARKLAGRKCNIIFGYIKNDGSRGMAAVEIVIFESSSCEPLVE
jgi:hypothetical protein